MQTLALDEQVVVRCSDVAKIVGVTRHAIGAAARQGTIESINTPVGCLYTPEAIADCARRVRRRTWETTKEGQQA